MRFIAIFFTGLLFLSLFFGVINSVSAQEDMATSEASPSGTINSYNLLWPLTAGKTEADSFYFLKLIKEQITGWFIFGDIRKADYEIYLGSKRYLEAEKLLKEGKVESALRAFEKADSHLHSAYNHVKSASSNGKISRDEIRRDRLIHIKALIDQLRPTAPDAETALDQVKDRADSILRDYLP